MRPVMYATLLGLIAATGIGVAEALALQLDDLTADGLVIRESKLQKSRRRHDRHSMDICWRADKRPSGIILSSYRLPTGRCPCITVRNVFLHLLDRTKLRGHAGRDLHTHTGLNDTHMQALIAEVLAARS
jgi:integrase